MGPFLYLKQGQVHVCLPLGRVEIVYLPQREAVCLGFGIVSEGFLLVVSANILFDKAKMCLQGER